jgi:hypothetical protein
MSLGDAKRCRKDQSSNPRHGHRVQHHGCETDCDKHDGPDDPRSRLVLRHSAHARDRIATAARFRTNKVYPSRLGRFWLRAPRAMPTVRRETVRELRLAVEVFLGKADEGFRAATVRERGLTLASTRDSPLPHGRGSKTRSVNKRQTRDRPVDPGGGSRRRTGSQRPSIACSTDAGRVPT